MEYKEKSGDDAILALIEQEKKSTATTTLLTFAICALAIVQAREIVFSVGGIYPLLIGFVVIGLIGLSAAAGHENISEVLKKEFKLFGEDWDYT